MCITTRATMSRGPGPGRKANVAHDVIMSMGLGVACIKWCIHVMMDGGGRLYERVLMIILRTLVCSTRHEGEANNNL